MAMLERICKDNEVLIFAKATINTTKYTDIGTCQYIIDKYYDKKIDDYGKFAEDMSFISSHNNKKFNPAKSIMVTNLEFRSSDLNSFNLFNDFKFQLDGTTCQGKIDTYINSLPYSMIMDLRYDGCATFIFPDAVKTINMHGDENYFERATLVLNTRLDTNIDIEIYLRTLLGQKAINYYNSGEF